MKPAVTLSLCLFSALLMLLPDSVKAMLYFDRELVASGQIWQLITGHLLHADFQHLAWNLLGLAILGGIIERRSRVLLLVSLVLGMVAVDTLVLSPFAEIQRYCGLSGALNTLLGVVLYCYWRETRSWYVVLAGILSLGKIFIEIQMADSLFTHISWPPYPLAHLAGILATPVVFAACQAISFGGFRINKFIPNQSSS